MHVLLITSEPYPTPADPLSGIFQQQQARALRRAGVRVGVLSPELRSLRNARPCWYSTGRGVALEDDSGVTVVRRRGLYWIPFSERGHQHSWTSAAMSAFRCYASVQGRPDIIHAHNTWPAGIAARALASSHQLPFCVTEHSSAFSRGAVPAGVMVPLKAALAAASARAAVSRSLANTLESLTGPLPGGYRVVPNMLGADFERERADSPRGEGDDRWRIINIGNLLPIKGQEVLLQAFQLQFPDDPRVELHIVGEGPLLGYLKARARELGIADRVHFLGQLDQGAVRRALSGGDVYVHSSRYETFGVAVIEALSCGLPVVSTACGGPDDLVTTRNGRLVPVDDPAALGRAMAEVRAAPEAFDAGRIRQECLERFGQAAVARALIEIYAESTRSRPGED